MHNKHVQYMIVHLKARFFYYNNFKLTAKVKMYLMPKTCILRTKIKNISNAIPEINEVVILLVFGVIHKTKMSRVNARPTNLIE